MSTWDADRVPEQITVRLDDSLAENTRQAAAAAGATLSEWVRTAIRQQVALATARRARAEEDARPALRSNEHDERLVMARRRRAAAAFDDLDR
jgi:antitoxin component of RelBE/YafQ-DinJ toxin-antitoxin module